MGIPDHLTRLLRNLYSGQEATVRTGQGTTDWFKLRKEYVKSVCCHPAYLTSMQSTSWETLGWMKHKLESRLPGEVSITSDTHMTPLLGQKAKKNWKRHMCPNVHHSTVYYYYFYFILLYNTVLVLPYIDMYPPWVYMRSQTWTPSHLPPHNISLGHHCAPAPSML